MSSRFIQYAFSAGVVSPSVWGQTILQKYGFGLAAAENYIVRYTGSLLSRAGFLSAVTFPQGEKNFRLVPFIFARDVANTALVYVTAGKFRFVRAGRYQLEASKVCTSIAAGAGNRLEITSNAHGYSVNDLVELRYTTGVEKSYTNVTFRVMAATTNTITLATILDNYSPFAYGFIAGAVSDLVVARVYTLPNDYTEEELSFLSFKQARDVIRITSLTRAPQTLVRNVDQTWTLTTLTMVPAVASPTALVLDDKSGAGSAGTIFVVTAVFADGQESLPSNFCFLSGIVNYTNTAGWVRLKWGAVTGATSYKVYRTRVVDGDENITLAMEFGYVGQVYGPRFTDDNIIPDFTSAFPSDYNPFAVRSIETVTVLTSGTGYSSSDLIKITDTAPDYQQAYGSPIVVDGAIVGVYLLSSGARYVTPVVTVVKANGTPSAGSGATFSTTLSPAEGNFPAVSGFHEQRQVYASTENNPLRVFGSQIGFFNNFTRSRIVAANESYEFDPSSETLGYIRHIVSTRAGMLLFSDVGIWLVSADGAISPTNVNFDLQTAIGTSGLPPLSIDRDLLYAEPNNKRVRLLQFNDYSREYGGKDMSVLSMDLLNLSLVSWDFQTRPDNLVWAARSDGIMLSFTLSVEQEVYAWASHKTDGSFKTVVTLPTQEIEQVYAVVDRLTSDNVVYRTLEYLADREKSNHFTHVGVDEAVGFGFTYPDLDLFFTGLENDTNVKITASAAFPTPIVGAVINSKLGSFLIRTNTSANFCVADRIAPRTDEELKPQIGEIFSGDWSLSRQQTFVPVKAGIDFGRTYVISADGDRMEAVPEWTAEGEIILPLPIPSFAGYLGREFFTAFKTLPLAQSGVLIEASRKLIKAVTVRHKQSRGLSFGTYAENLYPMDESINPILGDRPMLTSAVSHILMDADFDEDGSLFAKTSGAYQNEVLSLVIEAELGDEVS